MKVGIFAKTFDGTNPRVVLSAVAAAGFRVAQFNMACSGLPSMPAAIPNDVSDAIKGATHAAGVEIAALSGTYNMIHPDLAKRTHGHTCLEVLAASASALPTKLITLCTGTRDPDDQWRWSADNDTRDAWRDLLLSMETAVEIADKYDIFLGIEPELANVVNSAEKARRLIDEIGSPRLKIVLDPANLFEAASVDRQRYIVSTAIELLADRIAMGHAKDRTPTGDFTTTGNGILDYHHYLSCLKAAAFNGPLVAHGLAASEAAGVAAFLYRALDEAGIEAQR
jgi:sugar phosphate isomerase/epimerase